MKSARHQAILDLIEKHPIDRQEDLLAHLREAGFDVTQATVSRDIRDRSFGSSGTKPLSAKTSSPSVATRKPPLFLVFPFSV